MAVSQKTPTTYYYTNDATFVEFMTQLANTTNPPMVLSISYAQYEEGIGSSAAEAFDVELIKLGGPLLNFYFQFFIMEF